MSNISDNKGKDGIITDKAELEKLLRQRKLFNNNPDPLGNKLLNSASCYMTGPPVPDFKPSRGGKGTILDNEVMCYLVGSRGLDALEDIDFSDVSNNQDNDGDDDEKDDDEKDNDEKDDSKQDDDKQNEDFDINDVDVMCYFMTE